jgi:hypothetical protein
MSTSHSIVRTPWDAAWHLRAELARLLDAIADLLRRQRQRGRSPIGDAVGGLVIEEGEAEGLIAALATDLTRGIDRGFVPPSPSTQMRDEIERRADQGVAQGVFLPLRHARRAFDLDSLEYDALLLALAVEVEGRFGRIVAYLNDHIARTRPTVGLALALASTDSEILPSAAGLTDRPFLRDALIETEGDAPLPGRTLRLADDLVNRLTGCPDRQAPHHWLSVHQCDPGLLDRLVIDAPIRKDVVAWSDSLRARLRTPPLLLVGTPGAGRATIARAALFHAGMSVIQADVAADAVEGRMRIVRRDARWHSAAIVVRTTAAPQQTLDWPTIWAAIGKDRVGVVAVPPEQLAEAAASSPVEPAVIRLDEPSVPFRKRLWTALLPRGARLEDSEIGELASRFPFGPGRIARTIRRATADLCLRPPSDRMLDFAALIAAAREIDTATIGPLAQKLPLPFQRSDLIVPAHVAAELDLAIAWVRHRHRVLHDWGFVRRLSMGYGLTALFSGPSGTGKTMAAQVVAGELGLDLYRVDLSQIMSKYIGETEKNLALVFGARVGVLFFDEAEVVLGRRHETKDARDRYANIEIAYLLQRMEEYDGVTILATNRMQDIDDAFIRRLHVVVDFPMPLEADRLRIWEGMLPATANRGPDLDLRELAREFEVSGGQIKNAMLAGAFLAAAAGQPIGMEHMQRAMRRELVKSGRVIDMSR